MRFTTVLITTIILAELLTSPALAIQPSNFEKTYTGSWTNTFDSCGPVGQTGILTVQLNQIKRNGTVSTAVITFSDASAMFGSGKITKSGSSRKLKIDYSGGGKSWYRLTGKITKHAITGVYIHTTKKCYWGGDVTLAS
ncbi:MAG: hypothetical protein HYV33_05810 [Candidatus Kerfeldbacteria bacterium]|nr:hypothetical protein [Candidatus Kerfeldbacteria bacterium]